MDLGDYTEGDWGPLQPILNCRCFPHPVALSGFPPDSYSIYRNLESHAGDNHHNPNEMLVKC
jgi:hypothetical protein